MKKLIISLVVLVVVSFGAYYLFFNNGSNVTPSSTPTATNILVTSTPEPTVQPSVTPSPTATPTASVSKTPAPKNVSISIIGFAFNPSTLTVKKGTKVIWTNNDSVAHTVTSDSGNLLNSSVIAPGQSFSFIFTGVSTTNYHCAIHATMKGSIVVTN